MKSKNKIKNLKKILLILLNQIPLHYHFSEARLIYYISKIFKLNSKSQVLENKDIKKSKDTIFILGSGYSINDISPKDWKKMKTQGDMFSFNYFFEGKFVPINYHLVRETVKFRSVLFNKQKFIDFFSKLFNNPCYKDSVYFILYDYRSPSTTWSVFFLKLLKNKKICFYKNNPDRSKIEVPSEDINNIPHCNATLCDVINLSYILGYKNIVLVGVDLYDRRYFWLGENETHKGDLLRDSSFKDIHNTADPVLKTMKIWKKYLSGQGVELYIFNPKSLLNNLLKVYYC